MTMTKKEYNQRYYKKHKDKIKKYAHQYYQIHKEEIKEQKKEYRQNNRESILQNKREYYQKNKNRIKEYHRKNQAYKIKYNKQLKRKYLKSWLIIIQEHFSEIECSKCGYNKNFASIDFHHRNPKEKDYNIGSLLKNKLTPERIKILENEIKKCQLICRNCHMEIHYPEHSLLLLLE